MQFLLESLPHQSYPNSPPTAFLYGPSGTENKKHSENSGMVNPLTDYKMYRTYILLPKNCWVRRCDGICYLILAVRSSKF